MQVAAGTTRVQLTLVRPLVSHGVQKDGCRSAWLSIPILRYIGILGLELLHQLASNVVVSSWDSTIATIARQSRPLSSLQSNRHFPRY